MKFELVSELCADAEQQSERQSKQTKIKKPSFARHRKYRNTKCLIAATTAFTFLITISFFSLLFSHFSRAGSDGSEADIHF